ncbi:hypothetical protein [Amycolatopsis kentuckyensis]|uniref:hypothetical protein n=1 Tax=Amycolatopsis kentuckyensis TaxID=218823 RepID=UPI000A3787F8|nr:hypothetical protein [Amycolatopsis kentuckyensis]
MVDEAVIDRALRAAAAVPGSPLAGRETGELARLTGADSVERRIDLMLRLGPAGDLLGVRPGLNLAVLKEHPHGIDINALTDEQEVDPFSGTAVFNGVPVELSPVVPAEGTTSPK